MIKWIYSKVNNQIWSPLKSRAISHYHPHLLIKRKTTSMTYLIGSDLIGSYRSWRFMCYDRSPRFLYELCIAIIRVQGSLDIVTSCVSFTNKQYYSIDQKNYSPSLSWKVVFFFFWLLYFLIGFYYCCYLVVLKWVSIELKVKKLIVPNMHFTPKRWRLFLILWKCVKGCYFSMCMK